MKKIDLAQYHAAGTILLSGRPKGEALRRQLNLEKAEADDDQLEIVVPDEIVSLNSSFFSGLFGPSVREMGEQEFRRRYSFRCRREVRQDVEAGIKEALNTSNPLGQPVR